MPNPLLTKPPDKCKIFGLAYRNVVIVIALLLMIQNFCFILTFALRSRISCYVFRNGFYSLLVQFGGKYWSLIGFLTALISMASNISLLMGALSNETNLIFYWYFGGIIQFMYLLSLQSYCLITKSCHIECDVDRETKNAYVWRFGWCLFITSYFYLTFIFKIQLCYSYLKFKTRPRMSSVSISDEKYFTLPRYARNTFD